MFELSIRQPYGRPDGQWASALQLLAVTALYVAAAKAGLAYRQHGEPDLGAKRHCAGGHAVLRTPDVRGGVHGRVPRQRVDRRAAVGRPDDRRRERAGGSGRRPAAAAGRAFRSRPQVRTRRLLAHRSGGRRRHIGERHDRGDGPLGGRQAACRQLPVHPADLVAGRHDGCSGGGAAAVALADRTIRRAPGRPPSSAPCWSASHWSASPSPSSASQRQLRRATTPRHWRCARSSSVARCDLSNGAPAW